MADVREELIRRGVPQDEVDRAAAEGTLSVLAIEASLLGGRPRYSMDEAADRAGITPARARRFWRAMGFPDPVDGQCNVSDADVEALSWAAALAENEVEDTVELTRVMASSLTRVAEAWGDLMLPLIMNGQKHGCVITAPAETDAERAEVILHGFDEGMLPKLIDFVARRQLHAAMLRRMGPDTSPAPPTAVGFADLVGFTALSQRLEPHDLARVISRFEARAHDLVTAIGGRVVKMIGDEVMFVARDLETAARIALDLVERLGPEGLPPARAGLAYGAVLARDGDFYGPVVNLASRLVHAAEPGCVLVHEDVSDALCDVPAFRCTPMGTVVLKDLGPLPLASLTRA